MSDCGPYSPIYDPALCCDPSPPACNCPPSPLPPWHRETRSPLSQTLTDDGNISLTADPTYLNVTAAKDPVANYVATLPDGNRRGQFKRIHVATDTLEETQTWTIQGTFLNASSYQMDALGYSAVFEWDGSAWRLMSGNAIAVV